MTDQTTLITRLGLLLEQQSASNHKHLEQLQVCLTALGRINDLLNTPGPNLLIMGKIDATVSNCISDVRTLQNAKVK